MGRKAVAKNGAALMVLREEILASCVRAEEAGVPADELKPLRDGLGRILTLTATLGAKGAGGDLEGMLGHATDYLELSSILVIGWMWTAMRAVAKDDAFGRGIHAAARYWAASELPRIPQLAALCESAERSFLDVRPDEL